MRNHVVDDQQTKAAGMYQLLHGSIIQSIRAACVWKCILVDSTQSLAVLLNASLAVAASNACNTMREHCTLCHCTSAELSNTYKKLARSCHRQQVNTYKSWSMQKTSGVVGLSEDKICPRHGTCSSAAHNIPSTRRCIYCYHTSYSCRKNFIGAVACVLALLVLKL